MEIQVFNKDGQLVTTSLNVAEVTGKRHDHVVRDIEKLIEKISNRLNSKPVDKESNRPNFGDVDNGLGHPRSGASDKGLGQLNFEASSYFIESQYVTEQNKIVKMYYLTKKGTAWLINRYTGDAAVDFQLAYIERFEEMENQIDQARKLIEDAKAYISPMQQSLEVLQVKMQVYQLFEVPLHIAQIEAVKAAKSVTGVDHSDALKLAPAQNNVKEEDVMLEPTELGKMYGISGVKMNKLLGVVRLQDKVNDSWVATEKASGMCVKHSWTSGNKSGYNYKWNSSKVRAILDKVFSNYSSVEECVKELCN